MSPRLMYAISLAVILAVMAVGAYLFVGYIGTGP